VKQQVLPYKEKEILEEFCYCCGGFVLEKYTYFKFSSGLSSIYPLCKECFLKQCKEEE
jgi:hypothetical protein